MRNQNHVSSSRALSLVPKKTKKIKNIYKNENTNHVSRSRFLSLVFLMFAYLCVRIYLYHPVGKRKKTKSSSSFCDSRSVMLVGISAGSTATHTATHCNTLQHTATYYGYGTINYTQVAAFKMSH